MSKEIDKHNHKILSVCQSEAGFYVGVVCLECGPYSRNSFYVQSHAQAEDLLKMMRKQGLRDIS